jgi:hypothetical protein
MSWTTWSPGRETRWCSVTPDSLSRLVERVESLASPITEAHLFQALMALQVPLMLLL